MGPEECLCSWAWEMSKAYSFLWCRFPCSLGFQGLRWHSYIDPESYMSQMEITKDLVLTSNFLLVGFFLFLWPKISYGWPCAPSVFLCSSCPVREKPCSVGKHQASLDLTVLKSQAQIPIGIPTLKHKPIKSAIHTEHITNSHQASYSAYEPRGSCLCSLVSYFLEIMLSSKLRARKRHLHLSAETYKGLYFSRTWEPFWYTVFYQSEHRGLEE